jgi:hypothetical protein
MDEGQSRTRIYRKAVNECNVDDLARPYTQLLQRIGDCCESMEGFQNKNNHVKLMLYFDDTPELSMESNKGVIRRG